jgi:hypothetical protein
MPSWADLRPSRMARQLNIIWAYTFDPRTRQFVGRLAGNRITEGFGKSFRGARLEELHPPENLPTIYEVLHRVVDTPAVYKSGGVLFRKGNVCGIGERIILPLGRDTADGVIGASDYALAPDTGKSETLLLQGNETLWFPVFPHQAHHQDQQPLKIAASG